MSDLTVGELMSRSLVTLEAEQSVPLARELMEMERIRHLPVVDGKRLIGLVTYRDLLAAHRQRVDGLIAELDEPIDLAIPVSRVMRRQLWTVNPQTPALEGARIMSDHDFGCLPVIDDGDLVGIVTEADYLEMAMRTLARERVEGELVSRGSTARITSICLDVDDLATTLRFYRVGFGWSATPDGRAMVLSMPGTTTLTLLPRSARAESRAPAAARLRVYCPDLHGVLSRLEALGARPVTPLTRIDDEQLATFSDPSGNLVTVIRCDGDRG
ncbi:MAG: CBS domain-containing protein [Myxococcales bacterium]|nr:CBS domain-containing protein [Myxococcales bacterium]